MVVVKSSGADGIALGAGDGENSSSMFLNLKGCPSRDGKREWILVLCCARFLGGRRTVW
jgi:hypothetical protein